MTQTPQRRMYLMWRAAKKTHDYRSGHTHSPLMRVAMAFHVPIRVVRDAIDTERGKP